MKLRIFAAKPLWAAAFALVVFSHPIAAQKLSEKKFRLDTEAEVLLDLTASAPHTSWVKSGSEAAVATVFVDDQ